MTARPSLSTINTATVQTFSHARALALLLDFQQVLVVDWSTHRRRRVERVMTQVLQRLAALDGDSYQADGRLETCRTDGDKEIVKR